MFSEELAGSFNIIKCTALRTHNSATSPSCRGFDIWKLCISSLIRWSAKIEIRGLGNIAMKGRDCFVFNGYLKIK